MRLYENKFFLATAGNDQLMGPQKKEKIDKSIDKLVKMVNFKLGNEM